MSLVCGCDTEWEPEPGDWCWDGVKDYQPLPFKKRKRCCSCGGMIEIGSPAVEHTRSKVPDTDIEVKIYGEDGMIPVASDWMCERCGDLYFSLEEIGYCVNPREDMRRLVREHVAIQDDNKPEPDKLSERYYGSLIYV